MQRISLAPVLSGTFSLVSCWIIRLLRFLDDFGEAPVLGLRERARLDDANHVADRGGVLLVVGVQLARAADNLLVLRMELRHCNLDDDRLVALVGDHDAPALLTATRR